MLEKFLLAIILLFSAIALSIGINRPFIGHHDGNNKMFREAAVNYLEKSVSEHKFGQLLGNKFYTHHPPLLPMSLAGSMAVFGDHPWSIRLVPIIFSVLTL